MHLLAYLFCIFSIVVCQYEGEPCVLRKTGKNGKCKYISQCPTSIAGIRYGNYPQQCGFEGTQAVVCCEANTVTEQSTQSPVKTSTKSTTRTTNPRLVSTTVVPSSRIAGEISKQKCKEYAQYVWERSAPVILLIGAEDTLTYECSIDKLELIVGGTLATRKEFPHMAQIGYTGDNGILWLCGGSIISPNWVLTAAHCITSRIWADATHVRVGITNQSDLAHSQQIRIAERIKHPGYNSYSHYNDLGLLRLEKNVKLNSFARPACLYTEKSPPTSKLIASGWGRIEFTGDTSNDMLKVVLEVFDQRQCNYTYRSLYGTEKLRNGISSETMICAGSRDDFKDTCQGDSGGPLQIYHKEEDDVKCMYDIVGITSFGKACGLAPNVPGVYTKVSNYIKWIEDYVWPA